MNIIRVPKISRIVFHYDDESNLNFNNLKPSATNDQALQIAEALNTLRPTAQDFFRDQSFIIKPE